jgi:hypothetical protein
MTWYYVKKGRRFGPVEEKQMQALLQRNEIHGNTRVWRKGMEEWQRAKVAAPEWFGVQVVVAMAAKPRVEEPSTNGNGASLPNPASIGAAPPPAAPEPAHGGPADGAIHGGVIGQLMCPSCGMLTDQGEMVERVGRTVCASCAAAGAESGDRPKRARGGKVGSASELWNHMVECHFRETLLVGVTLLCTIGMVVSWRTGMTLNFPLRLAASTSYMLVALACGAFDSRYGKATVLGLFCCWIGSLALDIVGGGTIQIGLGAYIAGHCMFLAAFWMRGVPQSYYPKGLGGALVGAGALMGYVYLFGVEGPFHGFSIVLALVAAATAAVAYGARQGGGIGTLAFVGAMTLLVADLCILHVRFVKPALLVGIVGVLSYYAALMMLAFSTAYEFESAAQDGKTETC